ncbi:MAG TPA: hypothetical protein VK166_11070 [Chitinophagaceae bacterium]|nr:hypothetical protein [Chitinophagaceae bacterium]
MKYMASVLAGLVFVLNSVSAQISIRPDMVFNLNGTKGKDLYRCFDNDLNTKIDFTNGSNDSFMSLPFSSFVALDSVSDINTVHYYVSNNTGGRLIMRFYDAARRTVGKTVSLTTAGYYNQWISLPVNLRSVRLVEINGYNYSDITDAITEIQLLGKGTSKAPSILPDPVNEKFPDPGIYAHGVNIIGDRIYRIDQNGDSILHKLAKAIRFYWEGQTFDYYPLTNNNRLVNSPLWLGRYNEDHARNLLMAMKKWDIKPMMTKSGGSIKWLAGSDGSNNNTWLGNSSAQGKKYIEPGANPEMDTAWKPLAEQYFRLIALYGNNPGADLSGAKIIGGSSKAGQNLMEIFEWDNEPSRWWQQEYYHSPKAYYEAINAIYTRGKQADPKAKIYAGALPGMDTTYWKAIFFIHYLQNGNKPFPADGFNFNAYINDARKSQREGEYAISPESWGALDIITDLQRFFATYFPGKAVQWTEFGFATDDGSPYDVNAIAGKTERQVQADWTLRLKAIIQTVKFLRKMYYYAFFEDNTGPFNSMGLITDKYGQQGSYQYSIVQPVGYALANEISVEKNYNFYAELVQKGDSNDIWVTRKDHISDKRKKLYKVWLGSSSGKSFPDFSLSVRGARRATIYQQNYKSYKPVSRSLEVKNGKMVFPISESMTWIEVEF